MGWWAHLYVRIVRSLAVLALSTTPSYYKTSIYFQSSHFSKHQKSTVLTSSDAYPCLPGVPKASRPCSRSTP